MDIGDEPVCTFPRFRGKTLLSPHREFYIVVAQQGPTLFLQNAEMLSHADFARTFYFVEDLRSRGMGFAIKEIVHSQTEGEGANAKKSVLLSDMEVGDRLERKSRGGVDCLKNIHICGIYDLFIAVAETRAAFITSGNFDGTGWTVIKS